MHSSLILASTSPQRQKLLEHFGIEFKTIHSDFAEIPLSSQSPAEQAGYFASQKALHTIQKLSHPKQNTETNPCILAADTLIEHKHGVIGKANDLHEAKIILQRLRGQEHRVWTAMSLIDLTNQTIAVALQKNIVSMKKISDRELEAYLQSQEPLDKAGAYGIQGLGAQLIEKIIGDPYSVIGLSLYQLWQIQNDRHLDSKLSDQKLRDTLTDWLPTSLIERTEIRVDKNITYRNLSKIEEAAKRLK